MSEAVTTHLAKYYPLYGGLIVGNVTAGMIYREDSGKDKKGENVFVAAVMGLLFGSISAWSINNIKEGGIVLPLVLLCSTPLLVAPGIVVAAATKKEHSE